MNDQNFFLTPDDPRLTAFALGELEGDERAAVAAAIARNPALNVVVDDIRATAAQLEAVLAAEPAAATQPEPLFSARKAAIIEGNDLRKHDGGPLGRLGELIPFRRYLYITGGLAAAGLAVAISLRAPSSPVRLENIVREKTAQPRTDKEVKLALVEPATIENSAKAEGDLRQAKATAEAASAAASPVATIPAVNPALPALSVPVDSTKTLADRAAPPPAAGAQRNFFQNGGTGNTDSYAVESFDFGRGPNGVLFGGAGQASAAAPAAPAASAASPAMQGETVRLSPFQVTEKTDDSFNTTTVGTGGRLALDLKDAPASYSIINREFIDAISITDMNEAATWASGQSGQFQQRGVTQATTNPGLAGVQSSQTPRAAGAGGAGSGGRGGAAGAAAGRGGRGVPPAPAQANTESYGLRRNNTFVSVANAPLSTFSIDVDSAAYANVRRFIQGGQLPPVDAVRVEEMVNYFPYHYPAPEAAAQPLAAAFGLVPKNLPAPFAASLEVATAPWDGSVRLVRVGLKGREVSTANRPRANLVFLLDVSGSMDQPNKLPLVKESMRLLLRRLREDDRVAIVVYAGASGVALPSTNAANGGVIEAAIERLSASGSTNGAEGINLAYQIANENFVRGGINRIILCTDGDFNVGVTNQGDLVRMVEERAKSNVFLTVLGFGMGNLKDSTLELLADKGNGNYGYIDNRGEAEKLLVDQVNGTLVTIAKDVKIQVEFNPALVAAYRLVGYENRLLAKEDFNNDKVDAGEIGAGHTVTALYEIVPAAGANIPSEFGVPPVDDLKYQRPTANATAGQLDARFGAAATGSDELLTVKIRYKEPTGTESQKLEFPLRDTGKAFSAASPDFKFAAAVAGFGLALRETRPNVQVMNAAIEWASDGLRDDPMGYRSEFIGLVRRTAALVNQGAQR